MSNLKINMNHFEEVKKSLNSKSLRVCVIGIGRIGLPTALSFAKSGLQTIGVDINEKLVQDINLKKFPLIVVALLMFGVTSCNKEQVAKTGTFYGSYYSGDTVACSCVLSYEKRAYSLTSTDCPYFTDLTDISKNELEDNSYQRTSTSTSYNNVIFYGSTTSTTYGFTLKDNNIKYEKNGILSFEGSK